MTLIQLHVSGDVLHESLFYNPSSSEWNLGGVVVDATGLRDAQTAAGHGVMKLGSVGSASAPTWTFRSDLDTGMYRNGADNLGFAAGGGIVMQVRTVAVTFADSATPADGDADIRVVAPTAATNPAYSFYNDPDTGMFRQAANELAFATAGAVAGYFRSSGDLDMSGNSILALNELQASDGSATDPSFTFTNDGDVGMYLVATGQLGFTVAGVAEMIITAGQVDFQANVLVDVNEIVAESIRRDRPESVSGD